MVEGVELRAQALELLGGRVRALRVGLNAHLYENGGFQLGLCGSVPRRSRACPADLAPVDSSGWQEAHCVAPYRRSTLSR
jgi:hypothetical protein